MKTLRLRTRVAVACAAVVILGMLICCISSLLIARHEALEEIDHELRAEAEHFYAEWHRHGGPGKYELAGKTNSMREWLPSGHPQRMAQVSKVTGPVLFRSKRVVPDTLDPFATGYHIVEVEGHAWRLLVSERDGVCLRMAAAMRPVEELIRSLGTAFALAAPVLLGFAALCGWWVAQHGLEPIRMMANVAERITADQLEEQVPVPAPRDEIQRLALVLNATFERLRSRFEQAHRFSADASHELRTPLAVLKAGLESLFDSPRLGPEEQEAVEDLLAQNHRLINITESLLLLSRADAGRLQLETAPTNITHLLQGCVEDLQIQAAAREIAIETQVPPELTLEVDGNRLSQMVLNLLDNAVKYNHEGGRISLTVRLSLHALEVLVGNTGPGIAPENTVKVFERFYRAEHTTAALGYGLGLSLSRELARAHGGELSLVRSDAEWTEFRLTVPCGKPAQGVSHTSPVGGRV